MRSPAIVVIAGLLLIINSCWAADLVLLGDYPEAVCIDGSPGGFYFVPGNAGILFTPLSFSHSLITLMMDV